MKKEKRTGGKRLTVSAIAGALALLTACGAPAGGSSESPPETDEAMGRYIETELAFPEKAKIVMGGIQSMEDGSLRMLATENEDRIVGPWSLYVSNDGGNTWAEQESPWLGEFAQSMVDDIVFAPDGGVYFSTVTYTDEFNAMLEKALETGEMPDFSLYPPTVIHYVTPQGVLEECAVVPETEEDGRMNVYDMLLTPSGHLLLEYAEADGARFVEYDPATGSAIGSYLTGDGRAVIYHGEQEREILGVVTQESVEQYDLQTGETLESIPLEGASSVGYIVPGIDGKSLFRCDATGIYRFILGGSVWERLVDGGMTSLGMPSVWLGGFAEQADGSFYVLTGSGDDYAPVRFTFSPETPSVPSREMILYSLEDNDTIRQAIGLFQLRQPDVRATLRVALGTESAAEKSDVLRTLNTELLAGKGPDVLVLDGLPMASYQEKGVLAPLDTLQPLLDGGTLLQNIAGAFEKDGSPYAVPLRFGVPQLWGESGLTAAAKDLSSLADWLEADHAQHPETRPLYRMRPEELIEDFYPVCAPAWRDADGGIRTEEFAQFLTDIRRIASLAVEPEFVGMFTQELFEEYQSVEYQGYYWANGFIRAVAGISNDPEDLAGPDAAAAYLGDGGFVMLPGQAQGVFVPELILGVNKNSAMTEEALQFTEIALSERVQSQKFGDGYPVNRAALGSALENPYPPGDDGKQAPVYEGEEVRILQILWPQEDFLRDFQTQAEALHTPCIPDDILTEMIIDETKEFFDGNQTASAAASAVAERTQAYLAE